MGYFVRRWETLGRTERIVALSIGLSAPVAIINFTVWAIASAYMVHEKSRVISSDFTRVPPSPCVSRNSWRRLRR